MMEAGRLAGQGKQAKIYIREGMAYKVYPGDYLSSWVEHESHIQQEVYRKTDIVIPECEYVASSNEIRMTYIEGITLADRMRKEKYKEGLKDLIALQLSIYQYHNLNLDNASYCFQERIENSQLDQQLKEKALNILAETEDIRVLCHFDFHFLNVMYDGSRYAVIDWVNAKLGNPILDIARTYVILLQHAQRMANKYLREITAAGNFDIEKIRKVIPLMAVLRMMESDTEGFTDKLLALAVSG